MDPEFNEDTGEITLTGTTARQAVTLFKLHEQVKAAGRLIELEFTDAGDATLTIPLRLRAEKRKGDKAPAANGNGGKHEDAPPVDTSIEAGTPG